MTNNIQDELLTITNDFWQALADRDIERRFLHCADSVTFIGTGLDEKAFGKSEYLAINQKGIEQYPDKFKLSILWQRVSVIDDMGWVESETEWIQVINGKEEMTLIRNTIILKKMEGQWKIVHVHGSVPDFRLAGQNYITNAETIKINRELESQVYQRTKELKTKNRELEIESSLERVMTVAMGMHKPDDMLKVCEAITNQLELLQVKHIRNVQTAIIDEGENASYMNYQYFAQYQQGIIEVVEINKHPKVREMIDQMQKSPEAFFSESFVGKAFKEWRQYRKDENQFPDPLLDDADELHFYFFSIGEGGLGISVYTSFSPDEIELFHRFRNVFAMAYQRFRDIQQAEAQAREARIEASLERVRARSMAMQKSEELKEVIQVVYDQFVHLHIDIEHTGFILDYKTRDDMHIWLADSREVPSEVTIPYFDTAHWNSFNEAKAKGLDFFTNHLPFEEKNKFYQTLFEIIPGVPEETKAYYQHCQGLAISTVLLENVGLYIENFSGIPYSDKENATLMRFGKVFQQTYTRFLDLQKAEAQAREAQIEAALERIRGKVTSMQESTELLDIVVSMRHEFVSLGHQSDYFWYMRWLPEKYEKAMTSGDGSRIGMIMTLPRYIHGDIKLVADWEKGDEPSVVLAMDVDTAIDYVDKMIRLGDFIQVDHNAPTLDDIRHIGGLTFVMARTTHGEIGYSLAGVVPNPPEEDVAILVRFAGVFDLAYRRFEDLKNAEARNREAQIELALERVRARTMSMQQSDELPQAATLLFQQIQILGMPAFAAGYCIWDDDKQAITLWMSSENVLQPPFKAPTTEDELFIQMRKGYEQGKSLHVVEMGGEDLVSHYKYMRTLPVVGQIFDSIEESGHSLPVFQVMHQAYFSRGFLLFITYEPVPASHDIFLRFANVFDQTYTRFLDLQKAEAQARESQIELGLERVRARAMAMQKSDELADAAQLLYHEFGKLDIITFSCGYMFVDESKQTQTAWVVLPDGALLPNFITFPLTGDEVLNSRYKDWKEKKPLHVFGIQGEANKDHHRFLSNYVPPFVIENIFSKIPDRIIFNCANFSYGYLLILSTEHFSTEEQQTIIRFAKAFEQTYTRFLDLQKAEANVRESKIEAALERVRSNAMAMHSSKDLAGTIGVFYRELKILSQTPIRCGIAIINKETRNAQVTTMNTTEKGDSIEILGNIKMAGHKVLDDIFQNWLIQKEYHAILRGNEIKEYYQVMRPQISYPDYPNDNVQYGYYFMFNEGDIYAWTENELGEEDLQLYRRFANVISLTYKRYKDLIQAEDAAREAQIETGLERVRSRTMAMQSCDELAETASVVLYELVRLGIAPSRLFIAIIENDNTDVHFYLTSEDGGKDCSVYTAQIEKNISIRKMYNGWAEHKSSLTLTMEGDEVETYFNYLRDDVGVPFKSTQNPTRRVQTIAYFSQGYIGIASPDDQPEETTKLLERFAAVFNLTYTRFNDLKQAEKLAYQANLDLIRLKEEKVKTEEALTELKAAQAQLIQAEKMASLGELTAGIAHEIQNPLNFVNNFSEVNTELIEEMKEELQLGNKDEAIAIANDIAENEQKINHHGKRADAIVKGMLQHSRTSTGAKEPTDINALADEYLRLAYHGLRAKDKTFNADMKTDFDQSIGKIEIIPQDIGRVILNLITNAFYAVSEKQKMLSHTPSSLKEGDDYQPTVTVITKNHLPLSGGSGSGESNGFIEISVSDNGPGIPHSALDKIFQPFFTTKPTGQGTGLGLSLSYDIVKAHGGELKVETVEGEGSEFKIILPL